MGALSHLQVIHFATHDSFAEGQNGQTHQPVEVDSLYRAMPNLTYTSDPATARRPWRLEYALSARSVPRSSPSAEMQSGLCLIPNRDKTLKGATSSKAMQQPS